MMAHEHRAISAVSARTVPGFIPYTLRRTGEHQLEKCSCGMVRYVWLTTFKVDAGAWHHRADGVPARVPQSLGPEGKFA
jgi:hypothetical protein